MGFITHHLIRRSWVTDFKNNKTMETAEPIVWKQQQFVTELRELDQSIRADDAPIIWLHFEYLDAYLTDVWNGGFFMFFSNTHMESKTYNSLEYALSELRAVQHLLLFREVRQWAETINKLHKQNSHDQEDSGEHSKRIREEVRNYNTRFYDMQKTGENLEVLIAELMLSSKNIRIVDDCCWGEELQAIADSNPHKEERAEAVAEEIKIAAVRDAEHAKRKAIEVALCSAQGVEYQGSLAVWGAPSEHKTLGPNYRIMHSEGFFEYRIYGGIAILYNLDFEELYRECVVCLLAPRWLKTICRCLVAIRAAFFRQSS